MTIKARLERLEQITAPRLPRFWIYENGVYTNEVNGEKVTRTTEPPSPNIIVVIPEGSQ